MKLPLRWLKEYVDFNVTVDEFVEKLMWRGFEMGSVDPEMPGVSGVVVGKVLDIHRHENSDHLHVCQIDIGKEVLQIVTGAHNVFEGALVPVVLDGGRVAGGHDGGPLPENGIKIKAGKLRGVPSQGMMCSVEELGSDHNAYPLAPESGIYIFDDALISELSLKPGDSAIYAFGMDDTVVEYEITSNRVDCYSVIGIAREAAAVFDKPFIMPKVEESGSDEDVHDFLKVTVADAELCPRYTARMVKNIRFAPSPEWMQKRLRNAGIRPINNLVDITNFVMLEYGQPMHAFDYDTLSGHEIVVKTAADGDQFQTLDGVLLILKCSPNQKFSGIGTD